MTRLFRLIVGFVAAALVCGCVAYPYGYPTYPAQSNFDRSWDAAVTIALQTRPEGSLQVSFDAPDSRESNPTLNDRWLSNYQRRMGR